MLEQFFSCPYCAAEISMLLDPSVYSQRYIEDCEVCCNPIDIHYSVEEGMVMEFNALSIEQ
ncbi:MAG: CPXCG motif-containing cysteine-rich protein [Bacteroidota bacterium]